MTEAREIPWFHFRSRSHTGQIGRHPLPRRAAIRRFATIRSSRRIQSLLYVSTAQQLILLLIRRALNAYVHFLNQAQLSKGRQVFRNLKIKAVVACGAVVVFAGMMFSDANELKKNYTVVDAKITSVEIDCYVKKRKKKLVVKGTSEMAYMDCKIAPLAAEQFGYDQDDVHRRATITYRYRSPVDNKRYKGSYTRTGDIDDYKKGKIIRVHAHNSEPGKSKTSRGNAFIETTG